MKARLAALALIATPFAPVRAAFLAEAPVFERAPMVCAPVSVAVPVLSLAPAPASALALAPAPSAPVLSALPIAAAAAAPAAARFDFVVRRGRNQFDQDVLIIDALDPADSARGTIGHVDVAWHGAQASLDEPLDFWLDEAARPAELSHFREHLWFGLAVLPGYAGSGLGSRLLDEAEARLRAEGVRTLFIRATETSVGFYRRRYGARVRDESASTDGEGETYYRLEIGLEPR